MLDLFITFSLRNLFPFVMMMYQFINGVLAVLSR